jgi:hypothetical protein
MIGGDDMSTVNVTFRVDDELKKQEDALFSDLGMSLSTAFIVDANNPNFTAVDGVLFDKTKKTLIRCPEKIAKGETLHEIINRNFYYRMSTCIFGGAG